MRGRKFNERFISSSPLQKIYKFSHIRTTNLLSRCATSTYFVTYVEDQIVPTHDNHKIQASYL